MVFPSVTLESKIEAGDVAIQLVVLAVGIGEEQERLVYQVEDDTVGLGHHEAVDPERWRVGSVVRSHPLGFRKDIVGVAAVEQRGERVVFPPVGGDLAGRNAFQDASLGVGQANAIGVIHVAAEAQQTVLLGRNDKVGAHGGDATDLVNMRKAIGIDTPDSVFSRQGRYNLHLILVSETQGHPASVGRLWQIAVASHGEGFGSGGRCGCKSAGSSRFACYRHGIGGNIFRIALPGVGGQCCVGIGQQTCCDRGGAVVLGRHLSCGCIDGCHTIVVGKIADSLSCHVQTVGEGVGSGVSLGEVDRGGGVAKDDLGVNIVQGVVVISANNLHRHALRNGNIPTGSSPPCTVTCMGEHGTAIDLEGEVIATSGVGGSGHLIDTGRQLKSVDFRGCLSASHAGTADGVVVIANDGCQEILGFTESYHIRLRRGVGNAGSFVVGIDGQLKTIVGVDALCIGAIECGSTQDEAMIGNGNRDIRTRLTRGNGLADVSCCVDGIGVELLTDVDALQGLVRAGETSHLQIAHLDGTQFQHAHIGCASLGS